MSAIDLKFIRPISSALSPYSLIFGEPPSTEPTLGTVLGELSSSIAQPIYQFVPVIRAEVVVDAVVSSKVNFFYPLDSSIQIDVETIVQSGETTAYIPKTTKLTLKLTASGLFSPVGGFYLPLTPAAKLRKPTFSALGWTVHSTGYFDLPLLKATPSYGFNALGDVKVNAESVIALPVENIGFLGFIASGVYIPRDTDNYIFCRGGFDTTPTNGISLVFGKPKGIQGRVTNSAGEVLVRNIYGFIGANQPDVINLTESKEDGTFNLALLNSTDISRGRLIFIDPTASGNLVIKTTRVVSQ